MISFEIKGGKKSAFEFQNFLQLIKISNNLGDAKSLITHPTTTTHKNLNDMERVTIGITDGLLRLSIGLEDTDDLIEDIDQALSKISQ